MTSTPVRMSAEEYLALPEQKPYLELFDGELVAKAMPDAEHTLIVGYVAGVIFIAAQSAGGHFGPEPRIRFITRNGAEYRLPDYAYWAPGKPHRDGLQQLPPTIAVEVRSPEETMASQRRKCRYMREYGVDVCWLIDPLSRSVEVFEADLDGETVARDGVLRTEAAPGIELSVAALFASLDS